MCGQFSCLCRTDPWFACLAVQHRFFGQCSGSERYAGLIEFPAAVITIRIREPPAGRIPVLFPAGRAGRHLTFWSARYRLPAAEVEPEDRAMLHALKKRSARERLLRGLNSVTHSARAGRANHPSCFHKAKGLVSLRRVVDCGGSAGSRAACDRADVKRIVCARIEAGDGHTGSGHSL